MEPKKGERYCPMCDSWTRKPECPACGMKTEKQDKRTPTERTLADHDLEAALTTKPSGSTCADYPCKGCPRCVGYYPGEES